MAANLPDGISRDHLLAAIRQFDDSAIVGPAAGS